MSDKSIKVTVTFESREDGGLRVWSSDVPGLILSHQNVDGVLEDVIAALEVILSEQLGQPVEARPLVGLRELLEDNGVIGSQRFAPGPREYVAYVH